MDSDDRALTIAFPVGLQMRSGDRRIPSRRFVALQNSLGGRRRLRALGIGGKGTSVGFKRGRIGLDDIIGSHGG